MSLEGEIDVADKNSELIFDLKGINSVEIVINGTKKVFLGNSEISLKEFDVFGKTKIKLRLLNNLRNLLGPHHSKSGELTHVTPADFYKERCVWSLSPEDNWDSGYSFAETGVF